MSVSVAAIEEDLLSALEEGDLVLPSMPEAALRIREAAEDENATVASICNVISADPAAAAVVVKTANSPLFRGVRSFDSLQDAVGRMGIKYACNLVVSVAMEQLFQATTEAVDTRMRESWKHATEVAALCSVLAANFTRLKPDEAMLAGLVHELGMLPVLAWADDQELSGAEIDAMADALHERLGQRILSMWDFPPELQAVPLEYRMFDRVVDEPDYVDLVTVAKLQLALGSDTGFGLVDPASVTALARLGIDEMVELGNYSEAMEEAKQLLG